MSSMGNGESACIRLSSLLTGRRCSAARSACAQGSVVPQRLPSWLLGSPDEGKALLHGFELRLQNLMLGLHFDDGELFDDRKLQLLKYPRGKRVPPPLGPELQDIRQRSGGSLRLWH